MPLEAKKMPIACDEGGGVGTHRPTRKRLNHRGPLNIDVSAARYFITICAEGHAPWVGSRVPRDRDVDATNFAAISDMILSAARWYHEYHKWRLALFSVMPDHLHFIAHFPGGWRSTDGIDNPTIQIVFE